MENQNIHLGSVESEVKDQIATITFHHPAHNSLPGKLLARLKEAIEAADQDDNVTIIVLKSKGDRTFCAGASFDELMSIEDMEIGKTFFMGFANVINTCRKCSKLIIARIQGKAVGGGVGIAAAADYTIATKYASIKLSELAVGIGPFVIGPVVQRKIGMSAFSQLAIDATSWQNAHWAKAKGLYTEVFEDTIEMDEYLNKFAFELKNMNPEAMTLLKRVFWEGTDDWDKLLEERAMMSGSLVLSAYAKNAIGKFKKA